MIVLRPDQEDVRTKLRIALRSHASVLTFAPTGFGKCLGRGTAVMMFDGTIKAVENVVRGDQLMGPDSKPRLVLSTCSGREMLYRVTPTKGEPYVVNASHVLSLKMTGGTKIAAYPDGSIQNIEVRDYLRKSKTFKHCAKGWRVGVDFMRCQDALPVDPYFLGLWLGDGSSRKPSITTGDDEIIHYCKAYFATLGLKTTVEPNSPNSVNLHAVNARGAGNSLKQAMRALGLLGGKHIPHRYKTGSRDERLAVLAGIIDTDGHLIEKGAYELTLKDERLFDDVLFLARSLGFAAYKREVVKTCGNNGKSGCYFRCAICGDIERIPVLLPRKKAAPRRQVKDVLVVGIKVEAIGEGDYFGFEIDGDRLFLLGDFTVTHNTVLAGALIKLIFGAGKRVIFCVHRVDLITQTAKTFERFDIPFSYIAAGYHFNPHHRIYIASIATLKNRLGKIPADYVMVDEAHLSIASGWAKVAHHYKREGAKLIGLTGSPERLDGKPLGDVWDTMVMGPSVRWLIEQGHLSRYRAFSPAGLDLSGLHTRNGEYVSAELDSLMSGKAVLSNAVKHWRGLANGKRTIAFSPSIDSAERLAQEFRNAGIMAVALDGNTTQSDRRAAFIGFADRQIDLIINCQLFCEGFDLAAQVDRPVTIECVLDNSPTQSLARHLQKHGRGLRQDGTGVPHILIDMVGGFAKPNLGLPDEDREWSLEGRKKTKREMELLVCPTCFAAHPPASKCPECGYAYQKTRPEAVGGRVLEEVEGELQEVNVELIRRERAREQAEAKTLEQLVALATSRGYRRPEAWAAHIFTARQAKDERRQGGRS